jgi:hypothetical protein
VVEGGVDGLQLGLVEVGVLVALGAAALLGVVLGLVQGALYQVL